VPLFISVLNKLSITISEDKRMAIHIKPIPIIGISQLIGPIANGIIDETIRKNAYGINSSCLLLNATFKSLKKISQKIYISYPY
jgi:hypothetical protein